MHTGRLGAAALVVALSLGLGCSSDPAHPPGRDEGPHKPQIPGGGGAGGIGGIGGIGGAGGAGGAGGMGGTGGIGGEGGEGGTGGEPPDVHTGEHVRFWERAHGVPGPVRSVGADRGGNVWAANGSALLLLRAGAESWESFTEAEGLSPWPPISVAGGRDGEVWVGYEGLFPDDNPFDDPPEIAKSGDVDRLQLDGDRMRLVQHYDISSPPEPAYPEGRDVLRTCFRVIPVLEGPWAGDVWFGCNHGMAMWHNGLGTVQEHQHTFIDRGGTMFSGDFRGLAVAPDGNVWIGGAHRSGLLRYADEGGQFWASIRPEVDVWPDDVALDANGDDWVMDMIVDRSGGLWVASFGNGVAHMRPDGTWRYLTTRDGLPDNRVYDLAEDPDGSIWMATDGGVVRWSGGRFTQALNNMSGVPGTPLAVSVDTSTTPRRVLIGTSTGAAIYDGP